VATRLALANQLRSTLEAFWPGAAVIFAAVDSPIALAFLRRYPSPGKAQHLSVAQLQRFCRAQHYSGRRSATELLQRLPQVMLASKPALPWPTWYWRW
jgi:hypothetical protein